MPESKERITLPLLITRGTVLFPNCPQFIEAARDISVRALDECKSTNSLILIVSQKKANE